MLCKKEKKKEKERKKEKRKKERKRKRYGEDDIKIEIKRRKKNTEGYNDLFNRRKNKLKWKRKKYIFKINLAWFSFMAYQPLLVI